jgi:hypothetical protein
MALAGLILLIVGLCTGNMVMWVIGLVLMFCAD